MAMTWASGATCQREMRAQTSKYILTRATELSSQPTWAFTTYDAPCFHPGFLAA